jgi:hypothetical protein
MINRLFNYFLILILVLISFVIGFNTGRNSNHVEIISEPEWWDETVENDSLMFFYGTATARLEEIALQRAENNARRSVLDYVSSTIESNLESDRDNTGMTVYSPSLTINKLHRHNSLVIAVPAKNQYKAFVQMDIPKEIIDKLTDSK